MKPRSVARATGPPCSGGAPDPIIEDAIRMGGRLRGGSLNVRPLSRLYDTIRRCRRLLNEARGRQDSVIQFSIPEVDSFKRIVRLAGRTLPGCDCTIADESINLSRFCKYCWRPTRNAVATVCGHHSAAGQHAATADAARYKQAQRLRPGFESRVSRIASKDEWDFPYIRIRGCATCMKAKTQQPKRRNA